MADIPGKILDRTWGDDPVYRLPKERLERERAAFLAYVYAECLVPGVTTSVEWEDEEPYYYVLDSGARFDLIGEWDAWRARAALASPGDS